MDYSNHFCFKIIISRDSHKALAWAMFIRLGARIEKKKNQNLMPNAKRQKI